MTVARERTSSSRENTMSSMAAMKFIDWQYLLSQVKETYNPWRIIAREREIEIEKRASRMWKKRTAEQSIAPHFGVVVRVRAKHSTQPAESFSVIIECGMSRERSLYVLTLSENMWHNPQRINLLYCFFFFNCLLSAYQVYLLCSNGLFRSAHLLEPKVISSVHFHLFLRACWPQPYLWTRVKCCFCISRRTDKGPSKRYLRLSGSRQEFPNESSFLMCCFSMISVPINGCAQLDFAVTGSGRRLWHATHRMF